MTSRRRDLKRRKPMNVVDKRPASSRHEAEYMIVNSGKRKVSEVEVGGKNVELYRAGATSYDKVFAEELKDKYKNDPNIMVIEKPHVRLREVHKTHHTVPKLPWKDN